MFFLSSSFSLGLALYAFTAMSLTGLLQSSFFPLEIEWSIIHEMKMKAYKEFWSVGFGFLNKFRDKVREGKYRKKEQNGQRSKLD